MQHKHFRLAHRYARALFELAEEADVLEAVAQEVQDLKTLIEGSEELHALLTSPVADRAQKSAGIVAILDKATKKSKATDILKNYVRVVGQNNRLNILRAICEAFDGLMSTHNNEVTAFVTTAHALSKPQQTTLQKSLAKKTGKTVKIKVETDSSLIGGLVVRIGSELYDASLKTKIDSLGLALKLPEAAASA